MADYLSPSAANYADLSAKVRKTLPPEDQIHLHYAAMKKYDGVSGCVDLDAGTMTSRTGEDYSVSCAHIIEQCRAVFGSYGGKVYGEVWHPTDPQSKISGDFRRQSSGAAAHLVFVMFDIDGAGPQIERYTRMFNALDWCIHVTPALRMADYFNPGTYGTGKQLMETYMPGGGYDGLVYYNPKAEFAVGKDKLGNIIKEKPSVTFDLEVVGHELGKGRHANRIGAIHLRFRDGKILKSSGMSDAERDAWTADPSLIMGKIVEIEAMGESSGGSLREPRYKGVRYDKIKPDF